MTVSRMYANLPSNIRSILRQIQALSVLPLQPTFQQPPLQPRKRYPHFLPFRHRPLTSHRRPLSSSCCRPPPTYRRPRRSVPPLLYRPPRPHDLCRWRYSTPRRHRRLVRGPARIRRRRDCSGVPCHRRHHLRPHWMPCHGNLHRQTFLKRFLRRPRHSTALSPQHYPHQQAKLTFPLP